MNVGPEGCKELNELLKINQKLTTILLNSKIQFLLFFFFLDSIDKQKNLGNNIGIEGFKYLSEGIQNNNTLKILHLDSKFNY